MDVWAIHDIPCRQSSLHLIRLFVWKIIGCCAKKPDQEEERERYEASILLLSFNKLLFVRQIFCCRQTENCDAFSEVFCFYKYFDGWSENQRMLWAYKVQTKFYRSDVRFLDSSISNLIRLQTFQGISIKMAFAVYKHFWIRLHKWNSRFVFHSWIQRFLRLIFDRTIHPFHALQFCKHRLRTLWLEFSIKLTHWFTRISST